MSGPGGHVGRGRVAQGPALVQRPPQFSLDDQKRMTAEMEAEEQANKVAFFREVGGLKRHGIYDTGCPKCGQATVGKAHCQGRERGEGVEAKCLVFGGHLHAKCQTCNYVWLERTKDDEESRNRECRGALRYDEQVVDGQYVEVPVPPAEEIWRLGCDTDDGGPGGE